ncbi:tyrosine-type recombinase/integrase [Mycolicibacterium sp. CBM1]
MVRYTAPTTFSAKMDAEAWVALERRLVERDEWTPPALRVAERRSRETTVAEYAEKYLQERQLRPRTESHYRDILRLHILPALGSVPLPALSAEAVRVWYVGLGVEHRTRNSHCYALLHAICSMAVGDGALADNPCKIRKAMTTSRAKEPVQLSVDDVARLADAIRPARLRALVLLSAWCGLRWGEVSELRRKDVGAGCELLTVARGVTRRDGEYRVSTPKSGKARIVVIPPHIRDDIAKRLAALPANDNEALLFPAAGGGHMNDRVFSREYFAKALNVIGCDGVRVHDLRHFAGTQTARVASLAETMGRLGHSTAKASLLYQGIAEGRDREVAAALSRLAVSIEVPVESVQ